MATKSVLVIPHVGTAYGHLIRVGELLNVRHLDAKVFVSVPQEVLATAQRHLPKRVKFLTYGIRPTVTSRSGRLDIDGFLALLEIDKRVCRDVHPDLILGDPGIRAGLLGERFGIEWEALMHGCYLPLPTNIDSAGLADSMTGELASMAWSLANDSLDKLVRLASVGTISSWSELRRRGRILIPNDVRAEPCDFGIHLGNRLPRVGFAAGTAARCVLTLCSSGDVQPPSNVLRQLTSQFDEVTVVGPSDQRTVDGVRYTGNGIATETLVGHDTIVICHGGHGTLRSVRQASRVIVAPGDLDQLCNALVAHANWGAELAVGRRWLGRLRSPHPFRRSVEWGDLRRMIRAEQGGALICA